MFTLQEPTPEEAATASMAAVALNCRTDGVSLLDLPLEALERICQPLRLQDR